LTSLTPTFDDGGTSVGTVAADGSVAEASAGVERRRHCINGTVGIRARASTRAATRTSGADAA
jgi:hypothetical protein